VLEIAREGIQIHGKISSIGFSKDLARAKIQENPFSPLGGGDNQGVLSY
jgi:hypothetical protein